MQARKEARGKDHSVIIPPSPSGSDPKLYDWRFSMPEPGSSKPSRPSTPIGSSHNPLTRQTRRTVGTCVPCSHAEFACEHLSRRVDSWVWRRRGRRGRRLVGSRRIGGRIGEFDAHRRYVACFHALFCLFPTCHICFVSSAYVHLLFDSSEFTLNDTLPSILS
jgi:hypothetical protein